MWNFATAHWSDINWRSDRCHSKIFEMKWCWSGFVRKIEFGCSHKILKRKFNITNSKLKTVAAKEINGNNKDTVCKLIYIFIQLNDYIKIDIVCKWMVIYCHIHGIRKWLGNGFYEIFFFRAKDVFGGRVLHIVVVGGFVCRFHFISLCMLYKRICIYSKWARMSALNIHRPHTSTHAYS